MTPSRLKGLDYLRGLMACSVMLYHYFKWTIGSIDAESILGRLGIYAVAVFYILSGLTLFVVYKNKIAPTWNSLRSYFIKRAFRIFPLLWVTVGLTLIFKVQVFDWQSFFLSITGLFGFFAPGRGIGTGVWSIGNELVFYAIFPVLMLFWKLSKPILFFALVGTIFIVGFFFAYRLLDNRIGLSSQWNLYINPLNQMFLFAGGFILGAIPKPIHFQKSILILSIILASTAFILYEAKGDHISLVSGNARICFSLFSFILCFGFYLYPWNLSAFFDKILTSLGESCYSIYLLHPIVYALTNKIFHIPSGLLLLPISLAGTLFISYLTYNHLEKPMMQLGRKFV